MNFEAWKEINQLENTKSITKHAIHETNIPIWEAGDIVAAELFANEQLEPHKTNIHTNRDDDGPLANGLFMNVWYTPTTKFASKPTDSPTSHTGSAN